MKPVLKDLRVILDCMSGVDGGISFLSLKVFLENLDSLALDQRKPIEDAFQTLANLIKKLEKGNTL